MRKLLGWGLGVPAVAMLGFGAAMLFSGCASFGQRPDGERLARIRQSPEWRDEQFNNAQPVSQNFYDAIKRSLASVPDTEPSAPVPVHAGDLAQYAKPPQGSRRHPRDDKWGIFTIAFAGGLRRVETFARVVSGV